MSEPHTIMCRDGGREERVGGEIFFFFKKGERKKAPHVCRTF